MMPAMSVAGPQLGIDFGTSNTVAFLRRSDGIVTPLLFDASPLLTSAVFAAPDGEMLTGADAARAASSYPAGYEPNPKQRINDATMWLGVGEYPVHGVIAAVLRRVLDEARRVAGVEPAEVVLTFPAGWSHTRLGVLAAAASAAGLAGVGFVREPVAAAAYFAAVLGLDLGPRQCLVVYDFGAGTFDVSVVRRTAGGVQVLAADGFNDVGGNDLDALVVNHARALSHDPAAWGRLDWPETPADQRASRVLWADARGAKEQLTRHASAEIHVPIVDATLHITRDEFNGAARPYLDRTVALTVATLRAAGVAREAIGGVLLVGGSSRIPLAASMLHRTLRIAPMVMEQPELVVAHGSLYASERVETAGLAPSFSPLATVATPVAPAAMPVPPPVPPPAGPIARVAVSAPETVPAPVGEAAGPPADEPAVPATAPTPPEPTRSVAEPSTLLPVTSTQTVPVTEPGPAPIATAETAPPSEPKPEHQPDPVPVRAPAVNGYPQPSAQPVPAPPSAPSVQPAPPPPSAEAPPSTGLRPGTRRPRRTVVLAGTAVLVVALVTLLAIWPWGGDGRDPGSSGSGARGSADAAPQIDVSPGLLPNASGAGTFGLGIGSMATTADGQAFVRRPGADSLVVIDIASMKTTRMISIGGSPWGVAAAQTGKVYVVTYEGVVAVVDPSSGTVTEKLNIDKGAAGIAVAPDGKRAYAATDGRVTVIDTATNDVVTTVDTGDPTFGGIAVTPDNAKVYVTTHNGLTIINTATNTVLNRIKTAASGAAARGVAFTPDGSRAVVTNAKGSTEERHDTVSVIDTAKGTVLRTIEVGTLPMQVSITRDGRTAYVLQSYPGKLTAVDLATLAITRTIDLKRSSPTALALVRDDLKALVVSSTSFETIDIAAAQPATT